MEVPGKKPLFNWRQLQRTESWAVASQPSLNCTPLHTLVDLFHVQGREFFSPTEWEELEPQSPRGL